METRRTVAAAAGQPLRTITPREYRALKRQGLVKQNKTGSREAARRARQIAAGQLTSQNGTVA